MSTLFLTFFAFFLCLKKAPNMAVILIYITVHIQGFRLIFSICIY